MAGRHRLREIISSTEVERRLDSLARTLATDYADTEPLFVVIAEGARRFASRLIEGLEVHGLKPEVQIVRARRTSGTELVDVVLDRIPSGRFASRDVLILDDIADEGRTLAAVEQRVRADGPASVRVAVLVSKLERRSIEIRLDYVGFEIEDGWVVGFGMDLDEAYRDLDALAVVEPDSDAS